MLKSVISKADKQFAATQKRKKALKENGKAQQERAEHVASLKALRLAKEAADKKVDEKAEAEKPAAKNKKPSRLPKTHRS